MKRQERDLSRREIGFSLEERLDWIDSEESGTLRIRNVRTGNMREFWQIPSCLWDATLPRKVSPADDCLSKVSKGIAW